MKPGKKLFAIIILCILAVIGVGIFGIGDEIKGIREMRFGIDIRGGVEAVFEPDGLDRKAKGDELDSARNIIEMRLDAQNISDREVTVDKEGGYIIVRFPWKSGETDFKPEQAIAELGEMAKLTFRDPEGNVLLEGKNVVSSSARKGGENSNGYVVVLNFDSQGEKLFYEATGKLVGKNMGIYMDEEQISNPSVSRQISGNSAEITNIATYKEAKALSDKINAGALPFSLKTTNFSTISPSLGNNALQIMVASGLIAFLIICIFMISLYKLPGMITCITLVLHMMLQMLAISIPQYTLTLPGIAGIILSLGMGVDTNIIISERITDELGRGTSIKQAIKYGYKNAFSSVLDGNLTAAIVAVILMIFGSGSMLSFGYTLAVGMVVNLLVGITVSRKLLQSAVESKYWNQLKHFKTYKEKKDIKFFEKWKIYIAVSATIFFIGVAACVLNGVKLDTQFTGGVVLKYTSEGKFDMEEVEKNIENAVDRPATVQITKDNLTKASNIVVTLAGNGGIKPEQQKSITEAINKTNDGKKVELAETYAVEPYIGAKAMKNAIIAIALSIVFIIIYIWFRFSELVAGVTASLALVHDVIVVFFAFAIFRIPLNDAFVAVVLTIIGYSINDTIVLYDRVRENRRTGKFGAVELMNRSTTQTLVRSINTSLATTICVLIILVASIIFQIDSIRQFSLPMFFGLLSGCYSSICVAGIIWAGWEKRKEKPIKQKVLKQK